MVDIVRLFYDRMRACVWLDGGRVSEWFEPRVFARGVFLHRYCSKYSSQRFLILPRTDPSPQVEADLVSIRSTPLAVRDGDETPQTSTIWSMLYADDAAIVSISPASLA